MLQKRTLTIEYDVSYCIVFVLEESTLQIKCCQSLPNPTCCCLGAVWLAVGAASPQRRPVLKLPDVFMNNWLATFCRNIWSPIRLSPPYLTTDLSLAPSVCSSCGSVHWSRTTSSPPGQLRRFDAEHPGQGRSAQWNTYVTHKFAWHLALLLALPVNDGEEWKKRSSLHLGCVNICDI